jgi:hypothetical protein
LGVAVTVQDQIDAADIGPGPGVAGLVEQHPAVHAQGAAILLFPFQGHRQVENRRDKLGVHGQDPEKLFLGLRHLVDLQKKAAQVIIAHHGLGVQAQDFLDGADGLGITALLGIKGGQKEAGLPVLRVQDQRRSYS